MKKSKNFDYEKVSIAVNFDLKRGFHKKIYQKKPELRKVVQMVKIKKGRMLDIGCGGGLITECLAEYYPNVKVYGCDISRNAIKYAKKFSKKRVNYRVMGKKFPYPSNYFDACLSLDVLEHVPDDRFFIKEVRRVLKDDGVFFGAIPCEGEPFTISWFLSKLGIWENLTFKHVGHIHPEYSHSYVENLIESLGFKVASKKYSERIPVQMMRYFLFMIPKEILEIILGPKKASAYNDSSELTQSNSKSFDVFKTFKAILYKIRQVISFVDYIDSEYFGSFKSGAWKMNLLAVKKKK